MEKVFRFSRGSHFGGMREYLITAEADRCIVSARGASGDYVDESNCVSMQSVIEEIAKPLANLDWKKEYQSSFEVMDGYSWAIEMDMGDYSFHSRGYVSAPKDYERVAASLEHTLCSLIAYGDDGEARARMDKLWIWPRKLRRMVVLGTEREWAF